MPLFEMQRKNYCPINKMTQSHLSPHLGHVPFRHFQFVMWGIIVAMLSSYKILHQGFEHIGLTNQAYADYIRMVVCVLPLLVMAYYDVRYKSFSLRNTFPSVNFDRHDNSVNYVLRLFGCYGIVQVLAQDIGNKTGETQSKLLRTRIVQWFLYVCTAYVICSNRSEALMGATLYFILKYNVSYGKTRPVCFDDV